jgi:hypothetical protein
VRLTVLFALTVAAVLVVVPATATADNATHTYELHMEAPNFGVAATGDRIAVDGMADFSVHPKSVSGGGTFTHTSSTGTIVGAGTWTPTELLDYQSYGCGIVHFPPEEGGDVILPPNFCGGKVKMAVTLTTPLGVLPAIMTVICIIGPNPPNSAFSTHSEGVQLDVPGVVNFNHSAGGDNVIIQTS